MLSALPPGGLSAALATAETPSSVAEFVCAALTANFPTIAASKVGLVRETIEAEQLNARVFAALDKADIADLFPAASFAERKILGAAVQHFKDGNHWKRDRDDPDNDSPKKKRRMDSEDVGDRDRPVPTILSSSGNNESVPPQPQPSDIAGSINGKGVSTEIHLPQSNTREFTPIPSDASEPRTTFHTPTASREPSTTTTQPLSPLVAKLTLASNVQSLILEGTSVTDDDSVTKQVPHTTAVELTVLASSSATAIQRDSTPEKQVIRSNNEDNTPSRRSLIGALVAAAKAASEEDSNASETEDGDNSADQSDDRTPDDISSSAMGSTMPSSTRPSYSPDEPSSSEENANTSSRSGSRASSTVMESGTSSE
ncbi:hypothetical protein BCR33DRAFT_5464 [Rhizoclosmatium globosum]|uniref:Uncharacterized protein n=1 Tax=Rhizoclosmatium globosum TaxID=329046 RepID=A0A1Y2D2Y6_9FUNG|nr:hypothetical protein BCR33DRAFT_5464 [Rhizoclosmatium globosum]|eukprot:ORY53658.1 hypothetical protein BCR33DRAFT_5464 [Rhizoclosmatium globosum]